MYIWNETRTHIQYEEEAGASSKQGTTDGSGLREITYRPSIHSKSTTCLGGCTERRGSAVSKLLNLNSLWLCLYLPHPATPALFFSAFLWMCSPPFKPIPFHNENETVSLCLTICFKSISYTHKSLHLRRWAIEAKSLNYFIHAKNTNQTIKKMNNHIEHTYTWITYTKKNSNGISTNSMHKIQRIDNYYKMLELWLHRSSSQTHTHIQVVTTRHSIWKLLMMWQTKNSHRPQSTSTRTLTYFAVSNRILPMSTSICKC